MPPRPRRRVSTRKRLESLACPLHHVPEPVWTRRHVHVLDAERAESVADRVDDRGAGGDGARLTDALDPEVVGRAWSDGVVETHGRDLADPRDAVVEQRAGLELAGLVVVDDLFVKRLRDRLRDAAVDLAVDDERVDDVSAVVDRHVLLELSVARLSVDLDHRDVRAERPD